MKLSAEDREDLEELRDSECMNCLKAYDVVGVFLDYEDTERIGCWCLEHWHMRDKDGHWEPLDIFNVTFFPARIKC